MPRVQKDDRNKKEGESFPIHKDGDVFNPSELEITKVYLYNGDIPVLMLCGDWLCTKINNEYLYVPVTEEQKERMEVWPEYRARPLYEDADFIYVVTVRDGIVRVRKEVDYFVDK